MKSLLKSRNHNWNHEISYKEILCCQPSFSCRESTCSFILQWDCSRSTCSLLMQPMSLLYWPVSISVHPPNHFCY